MRTALIRLVSVGLLILPACSKRSQGVNDSNGASPKNATTKSAVGDPNGHATKSNHPPQPTGPARIKFVLAAEGLPTEGKWKCNPTVADVNGDGRLDLLAIPRKGHGPQCFLAKAGGGYVNSSEGLNMPTSCGGGVDFGDLDKDGHLDLVAADHCSGLFVFRGDGAGQWQPIKLDLTLFNPDRNKGEEEVFYLGAEDVALGDIDGDGFLDIVASASDKGGLTAFKGTGALDKWTRLDSGLPTEGWANCVRLADMNGDGLLDAVLSYSEGPRVFLGNGAGHFTLASDGLPVLDSIGGIYRELSIGDVDGDGRLDIAIANWIDGPEVHLQYETNRWRQTRAVLPELEGGAFAVSFGDFNGDKRLDLVVGGRGNREAGRYYGIYVLLGDGKGGFERQRATGLPETGLSWTWGTAVGDFDKDGIDDFMIVTGGSEPFTQEMPAMPVPQRVQVWLSRPVR